MASGAERMDEKCIIKHKNFDIVSDASAFSDHHFVRENTPSYFKSPTSSASKAIAKEWKILEKNLPESIYVRAYEQRVDLLRAMIIGPSGTPYDDGLFFFDILVPPNYPSQPPKLHYHSHGYRLNPNLYANGKVCLSLLHTWSGKGVELWDPKRSSILQVLVSIQGLVLNSEPYYNEPGRKLLSYFNPFATKVSLDYNIDVFIMSCNTLLHILRKPPQGFQEVVLEHCCQRGPFLLDAIKGYSNGCFAIGQHLQDGTSSSSSSGKISTEFKSTLEITHTVLTNAFNRYHISQLKILQPSKMEISKSSRGKDAEVKGNTEGKTKTRTSKAKKEVASKSLGLSFGRVGWCWFGFCMLLVAMVWIFL